MLHEMDKFSGWETFLSACPYFTPPSCEEYLKCKVTPAPPSVLMSLWNITWILSAYIPCFAGLYLLHFSQAVMLHEVDNFITVLSSACPHFTLPISQHSSGVSKRVQSGSCPSCWWCTCKTSSEYCHYIPCFAGLSFSLHLEIHKRFGSVMWCDVQPDAQEKFLRIKNAYQTLVDSKSRSKYDASSRSRSGDWDPFNWDPSPGSARKSSQQQEEFYGFSKILTFPNNLIPCEW